MPRSFLVKKIKADAFQPGPVPAPTYHPLETSYDGLAGPLAAGGDPGAEDEGPGGFGMALTSAVSLEAEQVLLRP
ncbi:UNVERIFIED_CONTAM: Transcriptional repressor scratch 2 [Gekko kuhli]